MKVVILILKIIVSILLLLSSIALFAGYSYVQGILLLLIILFLFYWPKKFTEKLKPEMLSKAGRTILIVLFFAAFLIINLTTKKTSIYRTENWKQKLLSLYDQKMKDWPAGYEDIYLNLEYGKVHVVSFGEEKNPPILLLHAASMGAHSWAENLPALTGKYKVYAVDNIGEGNKSELKDALVFPTNGKELSDFYSVIADSLGIPESPVIGASNGGFIVMSYAFYYPDRVNSLILLGPMGLTQLSNNSIMMMTIPSMYPFSFIKDGVITWALGNSPYVLNKYGDWFDCIISATIPSIAMPVPLTTEQKQKIKIPVLLFLGTNDPIVGNAQFASETAKDFPDIQIQVLESSHIIGVEKKDIVNKEIEKFLSNNTVKNLD